MRARLLVGLCLLLVGCRARRLRGMLEEDLIHGSGSGRVCRLRVHLEDPSGRRQIVDPGQLFHTGDGFRFSLSCPVNCSVSLDTEASGGDLSGLWPPPGIGAQLQVSPRTETWMPDGAEPFRMQAPATDERFVLHLWACDGPLRLQPGDRGAPRPRRMREMSAPGSPPALYEQLRSSYATWTFVLRHQP